MTGAEVFAKAINVSRETMDRLQVYADLLRKWNPAINLVAKSTIDDLWTRHMLDSAQIYDLAPKDAKSWIDIGSGGGFPGLVIAALAAGEGRDLRTTLVESDQRKAIFLRTVAQEMGLDVLVHAKRIDQISPQGADVISARALAHLSELLVFASLHLSETGVALFPKGVKADVEVKEALASRSFVFEKFPSKTDPTAVVLRIGDLGRG